MDWNSDYFPILLVVCFLTSILLYAISNIFVCCQIRIRIRENKFIRCKIYKKHNDESRDKKIFSGFEDRFCLFPSFLLLHFQNNSIDSNIN